jgi:hypothetical protein
MKKLITICLCVLFAAGTAAEGSISFREDFSEPVLDPAWTVTDTYPGHGYYSLTGNSLRYYVQAWSNGLDTPTVPDQWGYVYYPCMKLSRAFSGTDWTFETKVTYYMPYSNYRNLDMRISFGANENCINFSRGADCSPGGVYWSSTLDGVTHGGAFGSPDYGYNLYYFEVERKDKELTLLWSSDGQNWSSLYNTQMSDSTAQASQYVRLDGASWATPAGSYADYDYISVIPEPATMALLGLGGLGLLRRKRSET